MGKGVEGEWVQWVWETAFWPRGSFRVGREDPSWIVKSPDKA